MPPTLGTAMRCITSEPVPPPNQLDEVCAKQLEWLKELAPRAKRMLALSSGQAAAEEDVRSGIRTAARTYGVTLIDALADTPGKLAEAAALCASERCDALLVMLDPTLSSFREEVIAMAARLRIPAAYPGCISRLRIRVWSMPMRAGYLPSPPMPTTWPGVRRPTWTRS